jgi:hypothetical protein
MLPSASPEMTADVTSIKKGRTRRPFVAIEKEAYFFMPTGKI